MHHRKAFSDIMKDEIKYEIENAESYEEAKAIINDWIDYYNNDRYQWELAKLSPKEYREYVTTGIYPLKNYNYRGTAPNPEV